MASLHITLLGEFSITHCGESVIVINRARLQSLLAYLVLHGRTPQLRQHVAFQLWPDSTEAQARNNLRKSLHLLRRKLAMLVDDLSEAATEWIYSDAQTIQWRPDITCTIDVHTFEAKVHLAGEMADDPAAQQRALTEAAALYQGDLLPSCYDEWIAPRREQLRQLLIRTLARLSHLAEEQRDYPTAIHNAQQLLHHDFLHEATYRRLMRLHMLAGNRSGALHTYHMCALLLQRELGVEPALETQQAHDRLLEISVSSASRKELQRAETGSLRLVGRQAAWRTLRATWQRALRGLPHFVLISGEAGIGKTRLAEELLMWCEHQGIAGARTRSFAAGQELAYTPVIEWLQSKALQAPLAALDDGRLVEVARLLPDLLATRPDLLPAMPSPTAELTQWQRQRLFAVLTHLFLDNREPIVLLIDDLQWCDGETLAWLRYLFSAVHRNGNLQAQSSRLLIAGTVRPEEVDADHPLTNLLLDLRGASQVTEIPLGPLNLSDTAEIGAQVLDIVLDSATTQRLFDQSEGNPLFIVEMARAGLTAAAEAGDGLHIESSAMMPIAPNRLTSISPTGLPPKVLAVIQSRLVRLSPGARQLVSIAAIIGRSFTFDLLLAVSDDNASTLVSQLDELWQRGIVRTYGGQTYDFSHDRIRDVAYGETSPVQRPHLHRQVADTLCRLYDDLDPVAGQLAAHYDAAGAIAKAVDWYRQAAMVQRGRYAVNEAIIYLKRALELLATQPQSKKQKEKKLAILFDLDGDLTVAVGFAAAEKHAVLNRIIELAEELGDTQRLYHSLVALTGHLLAGSGPIMASQSSLRLRQIGVATGNSLLQTHANYMDARVHLHWGHFLQARTQFEQGYAAVSIDARPNEVGRLSDGPTYLSRLCGNLGMALWLLGYPDQACTWVEEALHTSRQKEAHLISVTATMHFVSNLFRLLSKVVQLQSLAEEKIEIGIRYNQNPSYLNGLNFQGWVLAQRGDTTVAIDLLAQGIGGFRAMNHTLFQTYRLAMLAEVYLMADDLNAAAATLDEAMLISQRVGECWWDAELYRLRGNLCLAQGDSTVQVEHCYQQAIAIAYQQGAKSLELRAAIDLARFWQQQGKVREAHALLSKIYHWFTEGFDTADLQAAHNLLVELS